MNLPKFTPKASVFFRSVPEAEAENLATLEKLLSAVYDMAHSHYAEFCKREIDAHAAACETRRTKELETIAHKVSEYQKVSADREAVNAALLSAKLKEAEFKAGLLNTQILELKAVISALKMTREESTAIDAMLFPAKPKE